MQFMPGFHMWSSRLTLSTAKSATMVVEWTPQMLETFSKLTDELCCCICLCIPCHDDFFMLETDASAAGLGAVLVSGDRW